MTYLCGGINGLSDTDCRDWREYSKEMLWGSTLDPMRRDYRGKEDQNVSAIVLGDLWDILCCRNMLVNATRPSWGTAMEIVYAWLLRLAVMILTFGIIRRRIVCWVGEARVSPWLRFHSSEICKTLDHAIALCNGVVFK